VIAKRRAGLLSFPSPHDADASRRAEIARERTAAGTSDERVAVGDAVDISASWVGIERHGNLAARRRRWHRT